MSTPPSLSPTLPCCLPFSNSFSSPRHCLRGTIVAFWLLGRGWGSPRTRRRDGWKKDRHPSTVLVMEGDQPNRLVACGTRCHRMNYLFTSMALVHTRISFARWTPFFPRHASHRDLHRYLLHLLSIPCDLSKHPRGRPSTRQRQRRHVRRTRVDSTKRQEERQERRHS